MSASRPERARRSLRGTTAGLRRNPRGCSPPLALSRLAIDGRALCASLVDKLSERIYVRAGTLSSGTGEEGKSKAEAAELSSYRATLDHVKTRSSRSTAREVPHHRPHRSRHLVPIRAGARMASHRSGQLPAPSPSRPALYAPDASIALIGMREYYLLRLLSAARPGNRDSGLVEPN